MLVALALVTVAALGGGTATTANLGPWQAGGWWGVLRSGGLLFFAFAGYARIATLGEEVVDPARTIPRAVPLALGTTVAVYAVVATAALLAVGPAALASSPAPLATAAGAGDLDALVPAARAGGVVASLGVLLSLLAGVSRTAFAMAGRGDLPRALAAVHPRTKVPHRAEVAAAALVLALVLLTDVRHAIGFSAFTVLGYYAVTNAAAWTIGPRARPVAAAGLAGCLVLAATLPGASVVAGAAVLTTGALVHLVRAARRSGGAPGDGAPRPAPPGAA